MCDPSGGFFFAHPAFCDVAYWQKNGHHLPYVVKVSL